MAAARKLVVIGHGAAGLAAALSAAEAARTRSIKIDITLLEKANEGEAGGNTRWSPSYMRMAAPDRLAADFETDILQASGGKADLRYVRTLAEKAVETIAWLQRLGVAFATPTYYLSVGPPRIQPVGGGRAIVEHLSQVVRQAGVSVNYGCSATRLVVDGEARLSGVEALRTDGTSHLMAADAVVLACGGFQGSPDMLTQHFGPAVAAMKLISPGTRFDTGDGIRLAAGLGATMSGDWNGMHAEPVDPRSTQSAPVVLVYPYGVVVDQDGDRFFDEGGGLVHETWEAFARDIQVSRLARVYAILDQRLFDIAGFERAIRSEVTPYRATTLEALADLIEIPSDRLKRTVALYNTACVGDLRQFDATRCDGLRTVAGLMPPKSNWARPITKPPFVAYPLVGAIAYTFGGVATNERAEVQRDNGVIPGLYAAGEVTGHFYGTAPNAVSMLRALVYGRIAGRGAVDFLTTRTN